VQRERRAWSWARRVETTNLALLSTTETTDPPGAEVAGVVVLVTVASPR
jgi:hypothetical protein